jgi:hypothetical protein
MSEWKNDPQPNKDKIKDITKNLQSVKQYLEQLLQKDLEQLNMAQMELQKRLAQQNSQRKNVK